MTQGVDIRLRDGDAEECAKLGLTPSQALADSIAKSTWWCGVIIDSDIVGWWGFQDRVMSGRCFAWALTTPNADLHKRAIARRSREWLDWMLETHHEVVVSVDPDYTVSVRWLEWLGFAPVGSYGPMTIMAISRGGMA